MTTNEMTARYGFPRAGLWNKSTETVQFTIVMDGEPIKCSISFEALYEGFGSSYPEALNTFRKNRREVIRMAALLIKHQRYEADGSILIGCADIRYPRERRNARFATY